MEKQANLLWTSGWDSTFRLLELLLIQKRVVQPYYIMDHTRKSLEMELKTIEKIKAMIFKKAPYTQQLLLPVIFKELRNIKPNKDLSQQYKRLAALKPLGAQYEWLACFAEEEEIHDLELSIETRSPGFFSTFVDPHIIKYKEGNNYTFKVEDEPSNVEIKFFKNFRFPIKEYTKLDLQQMAIDNNFIDIMNETWFCHTPLNQQPCGICKPCRMTIEEGLRRRLPFKSQLRNFIVNSVKPSVKQIINVIKK
ncbi:hypothetical protein GXP67_35815 [Rhodocytophaga rosea]|uniref:7-cyano-7-deazaguanine synthase n=1 Tax=Rhodocytophaga rosea TaxID=2704465 RepID=A0A6C0GTZ1_9BACT|nr:hypothetical protein [Rhodocytophaga rosea]QHT71658.1 hypothetical protein GXP67_35815 [Rhodocytophaga rosea]